MENLLSNLVLLLLVLRVIGIYVCTKKAKDLNRSQGRWGFFAFVVPIIAIIWIYCMTPLIIWNKNVSLESDAENLSTTNNNITDIEITKIKKPKNVTKGINLLVISEALSIIYAYKDRNTGNFLIFICSCGLLLFFSNKLANGKKWARTMFLILFIVFFLLYIAFILLLPRDFSILLKDNPEAVGINIILYITHIIGFFYIYSAESNKWYNSINNATVSSHK
jgi:hypothetical protein